MCLSRARLQACWPAEFCCISACDLWLHQLLLSHHTYILYFHFYHSFSHTNSFSHYQHIFHLCSLVFLCIVIVISISFLSCPPSFSPISESTGQHLMQTWQRVGRMVASASFRQAPHKPRAAASQLVIGGCISCSRDCISCSSLHLSCHTYTCLYQFPSHTNRFTHHRLHLHRHRHSHLTPSLPSFPSISESTEQRAMQKWGVNRTAAFDRLVLCSNFVIEPAEPILLLKRSPA